MVNRLPLNKQKRGEGVVKPGRHVFVPTVGTKEHIMDFLKEVVGKWWAVWGGSGEHDGGLG